MATRVELTFPFGLVHATPWQHHVNEGIVEWPLSPWRLLRSMVAAWKTKVPELNTSSVTRILGAIAEPPLIQDEWRTEGSIRTFLPPDDHKSGEGKTDMMIDTFVAVDRCRPAITYRWDIDLDNDDFEILQRMAAGIGYLGRSESVCIARVQRDETIDEGGWSAPLPDSIGEGVRTLVPVTPLDMDKLCITVDELRRSKRLQPKGARWVRYLVKDPAPGRSTPNRPPRARPVAVRLAIAATALPSQYATLLEAEALRLAVMSKYGRRTGGRASPLLSGKGTDGKKLVGNQHAHWIPLDTDGDKLLDTILVWVPGGLDPDEVAAIADVRDVDLSFQKGVREFRPFHVAIEAVGTLGSVGLPDIMGCSTSWTSITPFVPQRHQKKRDIGKGQSPQEFVADCVCRELAARGFSTEGVEVEMVRGNWGAWCRHRLRERVNDQRPGFGIRLRFPVPVKGPIVIGTLSHFGLGLFLVDDSTV